MSLLKYHSISKGLKSFAQKHNAEQEKKEIKAFECFAKEFQTVMTTIQTLLQEHSFSPHQFPGKQIPQLVNKKCIVGTSSVDKDFFPTPSMHNTLRLLESLQLLATCAICSLKQMETIIPLTTFYSHFGQSFEKIHQYLLAQTIQGQDEIDQLNPQLREVIRERVYNDDKKDQSRFFFESLRLIELRWLFLQPSRFLDLIDSQNYSQSFINHHLVFVRQLSDRELALVIHLSDESWQNLISLLDSSTFSVLFTRYHLFGLCALLPLVMPQNEIDQAQPLSLLQNFLGPFLPEHTISRLQYLVQTFPDHSNANIFLQWQLLDQEQEFVRILTHSLNSDLKGQNRVSLNDKVILQICQEMVAHPTFQGAWASLKKEIDFGSTIRHPYYNDLLRVEAKQFHESAYDFVKEAQQYQDGLTQKDYYPMYYNNWSYFIVAWIIAFIILLLFVVALAAYGAHKTQVTRIYLTKAKTTPAMASESVTIL